MLLISSTALNTDHLVRLHKNRNRRIRLLPQLRQRRTVMASGACPITVGQSLGGWVAEQLSREYSIPCLLTNPCLDPHLCSVIVDSPIPRDFLEEYKALSAPAQNRKSFTLCTKSDEVLGEENFDRCALLGGWLKEVGGKHSSIEGLTDELKQGVDAVLKVNYT